MATLHPVRRVLWLSPILIAFLLMVPRFWFPVFSLMDDGVILQHAKQIAHDWTISYKFQQAQGRFTPSYLMFVYAIYSIAGAKPLLFLIANSLVFCWITGGLMWLVRLRGGSEWQACAAGLFFVLSAPALTTFYTISKQEGPALAWVVTSLLLAAYGSRVVGKWKAAGMFLATSAVLLIAYTSKETAVTMMVVSAGWLIVGLVCRRLGEREIALAARIRYFSASILAGGAFFGLRIYLGGPALSEGRYSRLYRLEWPNVLSSLADWTALLARDFTYLIPLIVLIAVVSAVKGQPQRLLLLDSAAWMVAWMAVHLPWSWTIPYYLLPFTFGCAAFGGVLAGQAFAAMEDTHRPGLRLVTTLGLVLAVAVWSLNLANNVTDARLQLAVDRTNHDLVTFMSTLPTKSAVGVNVLPDAYLDEIRLQLANIEGRPDISVRSFDPRAGLPKSDNKSAEVVYVATPELRNQILLSFRVAIEERATSARDQELERLLGDNKNLEYATRRQVQLVAFRLHQPVCVLLMAAGLPGFYCRQWEPFVDSRVYSYGWRVYRVSSTVR